MAVIGRGEKFRIPIILHDNYFLYGKLVPPPKKLNIPWDQLTENYGRVGCRFIRLFFFVLNYSSQEIKLSSSSFQDQDIKPRIKNQAQESKSRVKRGQ